MHLRCGILGISLIADNLIVLSAYWLAPSKVLKICSNERLRRLDLFSFRGRLLHLDLILLWKIFHCSRVINPQDIFDISRSTASRGYRYKIFVARSRLEARQTFFFCLCNKYVDCSCPSHSWCWLPNHLQQAAFEAGSGRATRQFFLGSPGVINFHI